MLLNDNNFRPTVSTFRFKSPQDKNLHPVVANRFKGLDCGSYLDIEMEYSLFQCPHKMLWEIHLVFPQLRNHEQNVIIIPTFQKTINDMVSLSNRSIDEEKDLLLENVYVFALSLAEGLKKINESYWLDFIDPASGLPVLSAYQTVYPEVTFISRLLKYPVLQCDSCAVVSHPLWHTHCYISSIISTAPINVINQVIQTFTYKS